MRRRWGRASLEQSRELSQEKKNILPNVIFQYVYCTLYVKFVIELIVGHRIFLSIV